MVNLNLKYNNDDLKQGKNKLEINRIGNEQLLDKKMISALVFF